MPAAPPRFGAAILPGSARRFFYLGDLKVRRIVDPELKLTVSICVSEHQPLSEPAWPARHPAELIAAFDRGDWDAARLNLPLAEAVSDWSETPISWPSMA